MPDEHTDGEEQLAPDEHEPIPRPYSEARADKPEDDEVTVAELRERAEAAGLAKSGTKAELIARLEEAGA